MGIYPALGRLHTLIQASIVLGGPGAGTAKTLMKLFRRFLCACED